MSTDVAPFQIAPGTLAMTVSATTAVADYSFVDKPQRSAVKAPWVFHSVVGRPITRSEALQIARRILERAEQERVQLVEREGLRPSEDEPEGKDTEDEAD